MISFCFLETTFIDKTISISDEIGADVIVFSTLGEFSAECLDQINQKRNNCKQKIVVLQIEQLLNQTIERQLEIQIAERRGKTKSYRQLFVEHVIKFLIMSG